MTVDEEDGALRTELDAMSLIAHALDRLSDVDARHRVLQWAVNRFDPNAASAGSRPAATNAAAETQADPTLAVDDLEDLFLQPPIAALDRAAEEEDELLAHLCS